MLVGRGEIMVMLTGVKLLLLIALAGCGIYDSKAPKPDAAVDAGMVDVPVDADPCLAKCAGSVNVADFNFCLDQCHAGH